MTSILHRAGRYVAMASRAQMPSSMKFGGGSYYKLAVLELQSEDSPDPKQISDHSKSVKRIVHLYDRVHVGGTQRSRGARLEMRVQKLAELYDARERLETLERECEHGV